MKELKLSDLNKLYQEAEDADKELFSEQRTNVLLISGDHYNKKASKYFNRIRDKKDASEDQKLRLTKNFIHKIHRIYKNQILSFSPGVAVLPQRQDEMQDRKAAELNQAVWADISYRHRIKEKIRNWAGDFTGIGETAVKIFWDPNKGTLKGYSPLLDKETGAPILDEMGQPQADDESPIFSGDFVFETIYGFNLLRPSGLTKPLSESPFLGLRKMVEIEHLKALFASDPDKAKFIQASSREEFIIFDAAKASYEKTKNHCLVIEWYFRPCFEYPNGYFYHHTENGILNQGELPAGEFPILWVGFDEFPTAPRGRSIVKQARPYQAEINRASSQIAETQVQIGSDKILYQNGSKLAPGALLPGVRSISYTGAPPTVIEGRAGDQFAPYVKDQIGELYDVVMLQEEMTESTQSQTDPYSMLFRSIKYQKKFATYAEKFEQHLVDICEKSLILAKHHFPDDAILYAVGRSEIINIAEFKNTLKICYQIKVEERSDTLETQFGKQLTFNHILQYVGNTLGKDDVGKIMRAMPFSNSEEAFSDLTIDYDNAENLMLSLERGEALPVNPYDNHDYMIKKLTHRMRKADFRILAPDIQNLYRFQVEQYEKILAEQQQKLMDAKDEYIPVGGALIAADIYIPPTDDPSKAAKRARIPYQSLDWLIKKLESQGMSLDKMENMNQGALAEMASMVLGGKNQPQINGGASVSSPIGYST